MDEQGKGRFSNVGLLALRSLEQLVEACAAKDDIHYHENPRTAHRNRGRWIDDHHPDLRPDWDLLWDIYGALGYGGTDGERAREAIRVLKKTLEKLEKREGL